MKKAERWLDSNFDYRFRDSVLFEQALTHRSASRRNNERLEFLGDAVLDYVISEALFRLQPNASEGDLSKMRASLVKDESLAALAMEIGLGELLILGSGEKKSGGHRRDSILADALEALFGAINLDGGYEVVRGVIERMYSERLQNLPDARQLRDAKTRLQERLQARRMALPEYILGEVSGADHEQLFTIECRVDALGLSTVGSASSRRKAEQKAARRMLQEIKAAIS